MDTFESPEELVGPQTSHRMWEWCWLVVCVAGGAWLRLWNMAGRSLWADEITTYITANLRGLQESFFTGQDPQPPLYQLMLRGAFALGLPPCEWTMRGPAAVAGILALVVIWWAARNFFGRYVAAIVVALATLSPWLVHYSRDARPYTLFVLTATLSMLYFYRVTTRGGWGNAIGYILCTAAMFYTHYYAMFHVMAQIVFLAADLALGGSSRKHFGRIVVAGVGGAVLSGGSLYLFFNLLFGGMKGSWWIDKPDPVMAVSTMGDLIGVEALGVLCVIPLFAAVWLSATAWDRHREAGATDIGNDAADHAARPSWATRRTPVYLAFWIGFALIVPVVVSILYRPAWVPRYSLPVAVPVLVMSVAFLRKLSPMVLVLLLLVFLGIGAPKSIKAVKDEPGLREAARYLEKKATPDDQVVIIAWPFSDDYISPEKVGLELYDYKREPTLIPVKVIEGRQKPREGETLSEGRVWAVCFRTTVNALRDRLIREGRTFKEKQFGQYDATKPMYTIVMVEPVE